MKVIQHGEVIISPDTISIEEWNVEREDTDPVDATKTQLLTAIAVEWAQNKLEEAVAQARVNGLLEASGRVKRHNLHALSN